VCKEASGVDTDDEVVHVHVKDQQKLRKIGLLLNLKMGRVRSS
jgi:hypothetical protein